MLDETNLLQRLGAEVIGTAFLVFIGVGSVPATLIVNGDAPFTMADLGMISLAFGTIVVATVYALGHIGGNHINPAVTLGLAVTGKFPWTPGAGLHRRPGRRRDRRRRRDHRRARHGRPATSAWASRRTPATVSCGAGVHRRVRGHVHPGVHHLRRHPPQGRRRLRRRRDRPGRLRGDHPGRPDDGRLDQPGPHLRPDARPADRRRRREVGPAARSTWSPSSSPASPPRCSTACSPGPPPTASAGRGRGPRRPRPRVRPPARPATPDRPSNQIRRNSHEEAHQRPERRRGRGTARHRGGTPRPAGRPPEQDHLPRRRPEAGQGRHHLRRRLGPRAAARRVRRARACSTPPAPARCSPRRCPTRCWRPPSWSTAAPASCTS